jgi:L-asparagine transporter-like permease
MENTLEADQNLDELKNLKRSKRNCVVAMFIVGMMFGLLNGILPEQSFLLCLSTYAYPFINGIIMVLWCHFDSIQRDIYITRNRYIVIFLLFPVAVPVYVFYTRGWSGLKTVLGFALLAVLYVFTVGASYTVGPLISDRLF